MRKRNVKIAAMGMIFCLTFGACGIGTSGEAGERQQEDAEEAPSIERLTETEDATAERKGAASDGVAENKGEAQMAGSADQNGGGKTDGTERSLTEEELQQFSDYVNQNENYGFLLSVYDTPADIVLDELFYSGAGMDTERVDDEEIAAYLKETGDEELYTGLTRLTGLQIDTFLQEKTGISYSQMKHPLTWIYLPEYDAYYWEHGDTNYQSFRCIAGSTEDGENFTLEVVPEAGYEGEDQSGYHIIPYETTVKKSATGYQFVSNRMRITDGQIKDQTFDVEMEPFGKVTFAAYEPDTERNPYCDVTFSVIKDGSCATTLPGMNGEWNMLAAAESFGSVEAVSFTDYNGDSYTDVIAIINYSYVQGPDAGTGYTQARIYTGHEEGYFTLECEPSVAAGEALGGEMTVADILAFVKAHGAEYGI